MFKVRVTSVHFDVANVNKAFFSCLNIQTINNLFESCLGVHVMNDPAVDQILIYARTTKSTTTARKSILKLVKLQSLVAKCCKMRRYSNNHF